MNQTFSGRYQREANQGWLRVTEGVLRWAGCPGEFLEAGTGFKRFSRGLILMVLHEQCTLRYAGCSSVIRSSEWLLMSSGSPKAPCFNPREEAGFVVSSGNKSLQCLVLRVPFVVQSRIFFTPSD